MRRLSELFALTCALFASIAQAQCPNDEWTRERLLELRSQEFVVDDAARPDLSRLLVDCLGSPDPAIRDGVAFAALSTWLRAQALPGDTVVALRDRLLASLPQPDDAHGVRVSFAALALSEVARADRIQPLFDASQRAEMVTAAAHFMRTIDDYRGFDADVGWRHRVAHGADLTLQLAINPQMPADSVVILLEALATLISPNGVAYTQGEPERLARAVFFTHQREILSDAWWQAWLGRIAAPTPFPDWSTAQQDTTGIARRHDVLAFLYALHFAAVAADNERGELLQTQVLAAIASVLSG
jgi:hypothetical protein